MDKTSLFPLIVFSQIGCAAVPSDDTEGQQHPVTEQGRPNILFVISDDQSYPHTSAYGSTMVSTPGFDRIAAAGAVFNNFYVTSPGSSPSRASILTGLYPWQIEEAGTHASSFPAKYTCFPDILQDAGYHIGFTGKGWGPGDYKVSGRTHNPAGLPYNDILMEPPFTGISKIDYAANFRKFLEGREKGQPFCFWLGTNEPHRAYQTDSWSIEGRELSTASVPGFLPDSDEVRKDMLNYAIEIEWFDRHLENCIEELRQNGEFDNTIIIVTADNGMPFPRAKSNCYDMGIHVPLAICWGDRISPGQVIDALTSSVDLFPTLMDAVGLSPGSGLSGQSLLPLMTGNSDEYTSDAVYSSRERHSSARYGNLGYPIRSIRWQNYLLIWNIHPERWPAGDPQDMSKDGKLNAMHKAYHDIDGSPSKTYIVNNCNTEIIQPYFIAAVAKRKEYELYDLAKDPDCLTDLSGNDSYSNIFNTMQNMLESRLRTTGDTRLGNDPEIWERYPRLNGVMRYFPEHADEQDRDYRRIGWTVSTDIKLFNEAGNCLEGPVDGLAGTFLGIVKPGKIYSGVTNPTGGHISFTVDMKQPMTVNYLRLRHKKTGMTQLRLRKFDKILGSNDGISFEVIETDIPITGYDISENIMTPDIHFKKSTYRYLKFYAENPECWDNTSGNSIQVSEIYLGLND